MKQIVWLESTVVGQANVRSNFPGLLLPLTFKLILIFFFFFQQPTAFCDHFWGWSIVFYSSVFSICLDSMTSCFYKYTKSFLPSATNPFTVIKTIYKIRLITTYFICLNVQSNNYYICNELQFEKVINVSLYLAS